MKESKALCGKCHVSLRGPENSTDDSIFECPECGRSDKRSVVLAEVQEYVVDQAKRTLNESLRQIGNSSKFVSVTPFKEAQREFKYIASVEESNSPS